MTTDIWREFDPNLPIPIGLKNARVARLPDVTEELPDSDSDIDIQTETVNDDESQLDEDDNDEELQVPGTFEIVSQTVRTSPDGSQVIDVVIDVEDVDGAVKYEVRITK